MGYHAMSRDPGEASGVMLEGGGRLVGAFVSHSTEALEAVVVGGHCGRRGSLLRMQR